MRCFFPSWTEEETGVQLVYSLKETISARILKLLFNIEDVMYSNFTWARRNIKKMEQLFWTKMKEGVTPVMQTL